MWINVDTVTDGGLSTCQMEILKERVPGFPARNSVNVVMCEDYPAAESALTFTGICDCPTPSYWTYS
jgi:hypothetical protein